MPGISELAAIRSKICLDGTFSHHRIALREKKGLDARVEGHLSACLKFSYGVSKQEGDRRVGIQTHARGCGALLLMLTAMMKRTNREEDTLG